MSIRTLSFDAKPEPESNFNDSAKKYKKVSQKNGISKKKKKRSLTLF